jgi:hypothetical protein
VPKPPTGLGLSGQRPPIFVNNSASAAAAVITNTQKSELKQDILPINEEDHIEEEIEGIIGDGSPLLVTKENSSKQPTTQDSTSEVASLGKKETPTTEDLIEFSVSMKIREGYLRGNLEQLIDHSGSNTHTFGRRSRVAVEGDELADETEEAEELTREATKQAIVIVQQKYYQKDMIDP